MLLVCKSICFPLRSIGVPCFVETTDRIFSVKHPRRLFQTWPGGPGVCLKQQFIWARHFLRKGLHSFYLTSCILPLHLKFSMPQITSEGRTPRGPAFNRENAVSSALG